MALHRDARQVKSDGALRAALLSLISRMAYDRITVRDIVAEADIGYATFFRHFPSKDALLDAVAGEEVAGLIALAAPEVEAEHSLSASRAIVTYVDERRGVWSALLTGGAAGHLRAQFLAMVAQAVRKDVPCEQIPSDLRATFSVTATVEILAWWLRQEADYPAEKVIALLDRLVVAPMMQSRQGG